MVYLRLIRVLLAQQNGQMQLLIVAPILTLSLLSLVVRTASSAVDSAAEKKKIVAQLKRRLNEVQNGGIPQKERPIESQPTGTFALSLELPVQIEGGRALYRIQKNDTLEAILRRTGLPAEDLSDWVKAARKQRESRRLRPDQMLTLSFSEEETGGEGQPVLASITYEIDTHSRLVLKRKDDRRIEAHRKTLPSTLVWRAVGGRIESTLYTAAIKAGAPVGIVDELADLNWDLDFSSDLKAGDSFKVIFEEVRRNGQVVEYGRVLAAEIVNKGKVSALFPIPQARVPTLPQSSSLPSRQQFLRYPLQFTRISSVFTDARFHPVLKRSRPHLGVDFAAPRGTPVRSVADGKVTYAGWQGGFGRFVRIDHPGSYGSGYAHLHRIAKGVRSGITVRRGQVIGYVGSTGLATGPHLHFALYKNGTYINPLSAKLPRVVDVAGQTRPDPLRAQIKQKLREHLAALEVDRHPTTRILAAVGQEAAAAPQQADKPHT